MKKIAYIRPDGGVSIIGPCEGARLANKITFADGSDLSSPSPVPVDQFLRRWPAEGVTADWAETEGEFVKRIAAKDVPAGIKYIVLDDSQIPTDRSRRNEWRIVGVAVVAP